jgi:hypothetical protein
VRVESNQYAANNEVSHQVSNIISQEHLNFHFMFIFLHFLQRISSAILSFSFLRRTKIKPNIKIKMAKTMNGKIDQTTTSYTQTTLTKVSQTGNAGYLAILNSVHWILLTE